MDIFRKLLLTEKVIVDIFLEVLNSVIAKRVYYISEPYNLNPKLLEDFENIRPFLVRTLTELKRAKDKSIVSISDIYDRYHVLKHIYFIVEGYNFTIIRRKKTCDSFKVIDHGTSSLLKRITLINKKYNLLLVKKLDIINRVYLDIFTKNRLFASITNIIREYQFSQ